MSDPNSKAVQALKFMQAALALARHMKAVEDLSVLGRDERRFLETYKRLTGTK